MFILKTEQFAFAKRKVLESTGQVAVNGNNRNKN